MSRCPNHSCQAINEFEAVKANITNLRFPYLFIQCSRCETVVGVIEANYTPEILQSLAQKLDIGPLE